MRRGKGMEWPLHVTVKRSIWHSFLFTIMASTPLMTRFTTWSFQFRFSRKECCRPQCQFNLEVGCERHFNMTSSVKWHWQWRWHNRQSFVFSKLVSSTCCNLSLQPINLCLLWLTIGVCVVTVEPHTCHVFTWEGPAKIVVRFMLIHTVGTPKTGLSLTLHTPVR